MRKCNVATCSKKVMAKGLCAAHYRRMRLYNDPNIVKQHQIHGLTLIERFWRNVKKTDTCWLWVGFRDPNGYGRLMVKGKPELVHRLSWAIHYGGIPQGKFVLHKCDISPCVNPEHLYIGTQFDNMADMWTRGRSNPGHVFGENHGMAKLTEIQVLEIRQSKEIGQILAEQYNVSNTTISDIRTRRIWKHL